jgi:hypothetical protein
MMRCSVAGGGRRETETGKLPSVVTTGDRVASITESGVSRSAKPTRAVDHQEAVTGITAAREVKDEFCVAVDAARRPQVFRSNKGRCPAEE